MDARLSARRDGFKKAVEEDVRLKRADQQVQIRKAQRDAHILKKRQQVSETAASQFADGRPGFLDELRNSATDGGLFGNAGQGADGLSAAPAQPCVTKEQLAELTQQIMSDDNDLIYHAATEIRKLLSIDQSPPLQEIINCGVVPRLTQFLGFHNQPGLQFEAAWGLTNIASGTKEQTMVVVNAGAIPKFIELLESPKIEVKDQAVWGLGNIAGDCPKLRNQIIELGGLPQLLKIAQTYSQAGSEFNISILRNVTWTLSNICRAKPEPPFEVLEPVLPVLRAMIYIQDEDVLADAAWALSYFADTSDNKFIEAVCTQGCCYRLAMLLSHANPKIHLPALRAIGAVVTGNDQQTQTVVSCGALVGLKKLLMTSKRHTVRRETCWTISNIAAGTKEQVQAVLDADLVPILLDTMNLADFEIRREAAWAITNVALGGTPDHVEYLISCGIVRPLCDLLDLQDDVAVSLALDGLERILKYGRTEQTMKSLPENPTAVLVEQAGGFPKLETLQYAPKDSQRYKAAMKVMTEYLDIEPAESKE